MLSKTNFRDGEKTFSNGDVYVGNFTGILPHGKGKYTWSDGTVYEGDWEEGKMTGKGKIVWSSRASYEGEFSGGHLHGFGTFIGLDGSVYMGYWRMNILHGFGKKQYCNSDIYEGLWREGVHEGCGRYSWNSGNTYIGSWKDGKMCGRGVMKWANGDLYNGLWLNGLRHGYGTYKFANGGYYYGLWNRGLKDGKGMFYPAGSKHPSLEKCCSSHEYNDDGNSLLSCSMNSEEQSAKRVSVKRSLSEKISIGGILRSSSRISHRSKTASLNENYSPCDPSGDDFPCHNPSCTSFHTSEEGQHESDNNNLVYEREYMQGVLIKERIKNYAEISQKCKQQNKFQENDSKKSSWLGIFEGHRSNFLRLNLQLGIR